MLKKLLILTLLILLSKPVFAQNTDSDSKWKFAPLQFTTTPKGFRLVDQDNNVIFLSGGWTEQESAIFSISGVNEIKNNYGLALGGVAAVTTNYGLLLGGVSNPSDNYGLVITPFNLIYRNHGTVAGLWNLHFFSSSHFPNAMEVLGINIMNTIQLAVYNAMGTDVSHCSFQIGIANIICWSSAVQIGIYNSSEHSKKVFQIGLLNYCPESYVPYFPLINFSMGRKVEK